MGLKRVSRLSRPKNTLRNFVDLYVFKYARPWLHQRLAGMQLRRDSRLNRRKAISFRIRPSQNILLPLQVLYLFRTKL